MKSELQILLVEDLAWDGDLIERELRKAGFPFRLYRVETREQFCFQIEAARPDVILSDHGVPEFDGFEALTLGRRRYPDIPFIFVTGAPGEELAVDALKRGADDYVLKHRLHKLAPAIAQVLQARNRRGLDKVEAALEQVRTQLHNLQHLTADNAQNVRRSVLNLEAIVARLQKLSILTLDANGCDCIQSLSQSIQQLENLTTQILKSPLLELAQEPANFSEKNLHDFEHKCHSSGIIL